MPVSETVNPTPSSYEYYDDPLFLAQSEQPTYSLVTSLFDGHDFLGWRRDAFMALVSKNKDCFVDGSFPKPAKTNKKHNQWVRCDFMVKSWILSSLVKSIKDNMKYVNSAQELWSELLERYGQASALEIYQLKKELDVVVQDNSSLVDYYGKMKNLWETLDGLNPIPSCTCGKIDECFCSLVKKFIERENTAKLVQFLMGLNGGYDTIRSQILSMEPLPSINRALGLLQKIERQKQIPDVISSLTEVNAYATYKYPDNKKTQSQPNISAAAVKHCDHCEKKGHTRETCFGLNKCSHCNKYGHNPANCFVIKGFPGDKNKGKSKVATQKAGTAAGGPYQRTANVADTGSHDSPLDNSVLATAAAATSADNSVVSSDVLDGIISTEISQVMQRISGQQQSDISSSQSGASDHMTYNLDILTDINVFVVPIKVGLPDGSIKLVHKSGTDHSNKTIIAKGRRVGDLYRIQFDARSCFQTKIVNLVKQAVDSKIHSDQVPGLLRDFFAYVQTQFNKTIRTVRSDNGTEFLQKYCSTIFKSKGILHQTSIVGTPQQNGRVERKHRHLLETARALKIQANMPIKFWGDCLLTATYLINLMPSSVINNNTPFELLFDQKPSYDNLRVFGCVCYATMPPNFSDKFGNKARKCLFIGYPHNQNGYRLYDVLLHKVFVSRDVIFKEQEFYFTSSTTENLNITPSELVNPVTSSHIIVPTVGTSEGSTHNNKEEASPIGNEESESPEGPSLTAGIPVNTGSSSAGSEDDILAQEEVIRRSARPRQLSSRLKSFVCGKKIPGQSVALQAAVLDQLYEFDPEYVASLATVFKEQEPYKYSEAQKDPRWVKAMDAELQALESNQTWDLVKLPKDKKPIGSKWVYRIKYKQDGTVERFKARLVAKGFNQVKDKDFTHTFSPVAKLTTVRTLLAVAAMQDWPLY
ncbi:uncharacterized protein LOC141590675 [Silene latifolia]|uniref:uncharacterized protein LOC141590675 n=1 Tax=Silene latifolia TaxID=37657 RepID=UPI003D76DB95